MNLDEATPSFKAISRMGNQILTIRPADRTIRIVGGKEIVEFDKGMSLKFQPQHGTIPTRYLSTKGGEEGVLPAWGLLDTFEESARLGVDEKEVIDALMSHPLNVLNGGAEFVLIGQDGRGLVPESTQTAVEEEVVKESGDSGFYCELCDKYTRNQQGMKRHTQGLKHQRKLREREKDN